MDTQSSASFEAALRGIMTAVFIGLIDALMYIIYNIIFRSDRPYSSSTFLNLFYFVFAMPLIFFIIGLVYMVILRFFGNGNLIFFIIFATLTFWVLWAIQWAHFSADAIEEAALRREYTGITIIAGLSAAVGIPMLNRWRKAVLTFF